jgi:hypothetical protein
LANPRFATSSDAHETVLQAGIATIVTQRANAIGPDLCEPELRAFLAITTTPMGAFCSDGLKILFPAQFCWYRHQSSFPAAAQVSAPRVRMS